MLSRAEAYLAERRRLGFALDRSGSQIQAFARFADGSGHEGSLTSAIVLRWAKQEAQFSDPYSWARRVDVLRPFARYLIDLDPRTVFPTGFPFGRSKRRLAPHIYTPAEVGALIEAAGRLTPHDGLTLATFTTLFGLLAATGLRISEALGLRCGDLDNRQQQLTIRRGKFQRTRLVPLHSTTTQALRRYLRVRSRYGPMDITASLFLSEKTGAPLRYSEVRGVFLGLSAELGIVPRGGHRFIRIHDLRHTFICRRLMLWQENGADINNAMMALSTYVGHVSIGDTYWYLQAVPELMAIASTRFEEQAIMIREVDHD
ncbi:tyrosine-type recombinase/integrase (plasmid) [Nitrobacter sp. NHB1]|uniref:tyrosine-type recombinase/integrase n=1 Tax=Nitrobacter sp. NHB1 TaxID=3119830 RepID=UPI003000A5EB